MDITSKPFLLAMLFVGSFIFLLLSVFLRSIAKSFRNHRDSTATIYRLFHDDIAKPAQNLVTTSERLELHKPERFSDEQWVRLKDDLKSDRDRLTKLVHRLREVAMAEMLGQRNEKIVVSDCINNIHQEYVELAKSYEVRLTNKKTDSVVTIYANPIDFKNIVSNIVENGIRYSDAMKKNRFVAITTKSILFGVSVRIEDNGIGIPTSKLNLIGKEPISGSASKVTGGGGVGLFLIKKMADTNNIKITIRSEVGVGTNITITKRQLIPKFRFLRRKKL